MGASEGAAEDTTTLRGRKGTKAKRWVGRWVVHGWAGSLPTSSSSLKKSDMHGAEDVVAEPLLRRSRSVVPLPRRRVMRACYAPPGTAQRFPSRRFWRREKKERTTDRPSARVHSKKLERREAIGYDGA